jgi:endonuclease YncB( thermonuclease family)
MKCFAPSYLIFLASIMARSRRTLRMPVGVLQVVVLSIFYVVAVAANAAAQFSGRAAVVDGDDIELSADAGPPKRIRLCGIDAPEQGCPGYGEAIREFRTLVEGKQVRCIQVGAGTPCDGRSKSENRGRIIAQCFVENTDVAGRLVERGVACDWKKFSGGYYSRNGKGRACPKDAKLHGGITSVTRSPAMRLKFLRYA